MNVMQKQNVVIMIMFLTVLMMDGGTSWATIEINTPQNLMKIGVDSTFPLDGDYVLTADLDTTGVVMTPIGNWSNSDTTLQLPFTGTFDGQNHKIKNLSMKYPKSDYVGLFAYVAEGAVIKNLSLESGGAISGKTYVGGLIGYNNGEVSNCISNTDVSSFGTSSSNAGGLIGYNGYGKVSGCSVIGKVSSSGNYSYAGGLIGFNSMSEVNNCFSTGYVFASGSFSFVGGLIGLNIAKVVNCHASGDVVTSSVNISYAGGLIGLNNGEVSICFASSDVSPSESSIFAGGLIGANNGEVCTSYAIGEISSLEIGSELGGLIGMNNGGVSNCYAIGDVFASSPYDWVSTSIGGLLGSTGSGTEINNCYAIGKVTTTGVTDCMGGLIGEVRKFSLIASCLWDKETTGQSSTPGLEDGFGKTTSEMKTTSTFTDLDWDFNAVWGMDPTINNGYPYLIDLKDTYSVNTNNPTPTPTITPTVVPTATPTKTPVIVPTVTPTATTKLIPTATPIPNSSTAKEVKAKLTLNKDIHPVLLWWNKSIGDVVIHFLNKTDKTIIDSSKVIAILPQIPWTIVGTGDMDRKGPFDLLWYNMTSGELVSWNLNDSGTNPTVDPANDTLLITTLSSTQWQPISFGDLNADGYTDIIWQNQENGVIVGWLLGENNKIVNNNYVIQADSVLGTLLKNSGWQVVGTTDFNNNHTLDLIWWNSTNGATVAWEGCNVSNTNIGIDMLDPTVWKPIGFGDFGNVSTGASTPDGKTDVVWRNLSTGQVVVNYYNGTDFFGVPGTQLSIVLSPETNWIPVGMN